MSAKSVDTFKCIAIPVNSDGKGTKMLTTAGCQVDHLVKQCEVHSKLIIAFDYDDTVMPLNFPEALCVRPRELLVRAQEAGHILVLFSSNPDTKRITDMCEFFGIYPKDNPVFQHGNKMFYNLFLDDKCGLNETCDILEKTLDLIEARKP